MRDYLIACLFGGLPLLAAAQTAPTAQTAPPLAAKSALEAPKTAQTAQTATARVGIMQGKQIFCFAKPTAPHEIAFRFNAPYKPHAGMTLDDVLEQCLAGASAVSNTLHKPYDAIIIQEGGQVAITFRKDVPLEQRSLATVPRLGGLLVYCYSQPGTDYHVALKHPVRWQSPEVPGAFYTLGYVVEDLLATAKHLPNVTALIIGNTASYVTLLK